MRIFRVEITVDPEDQWIVDKYMWHTNNGYPRGYTETGLEYLHRLVLPGVAKVDHEDGNKLNCRKKNLRPATHVQNGANQGLSKANTSGYKGVCLRKDLKKFPWQAQIKVNGKFKKLGYYATPKEAAIAYNEGALKYHKEFAKLNIIED